MNTRYLQRFASGAAFSLVLLLGCSGCLVQQSGTEASTQPALTQASAASTPTVVAPAFLPPEALETLALIRRGGPYPHAQDHGVFGNREGHLPKAAHGHYREYTVATPGLGHRGARRIVTGGQPPRTYFYTDDHYDSFREFEVHR